MPSPSRPSAAEIKNIALKHGAASCGIAAACDINEYQRFIAASKDVPPGLSYLGRAPALRVNIKNWFGPARSALVCAFQYWHSGLDHDEVLKKAGKGGGKVSRYALVPDYHKVIRRKLKEILAGIKEIYPDADGKVFVDTSPVMEKELGRLAGLGFRGKNTLLISKELGSYFFIGGVALNLDAATDSLSRNSGADCGDCRRCIDACPTGALSEPGILDPRLCVSYWTTQSKEKMSDELQSRSGGLTYGCDLCQESCPHNNKTQNKLLKEFNER